VKSRLTNLPFKVISEDGVEVIYWSEENLPERGCDARDVRTTRVVIDEREHHTLVETRDMG
jgi:hypothetical protein